MQSSDVVNATTSSLEISDATTIMNSMNESSSILTITNDYQLTPSNPVTCSNNTWCCGQWEINADPWWIHRPHWEISSENDTHFCFTPMRDVNRTVFLRDLHQLQWQIDILETNHKEIPKEDYKVNCSSVIATVNTWCGLGSYLEFLCTTFWYAYL